ncbi:MAG: hypothetical protein V4651_06085 [Bacteroidota bacterium]
MKTFIILLVAIGLPVLSFAQRGMKTMEGKAYDPKQQRNEIPQDSGQTSGTVYYESKNNNVIQSTGQTYDSEQLTRMARKDVNGVASTVAGVESRSGEIPNIRNAGQAGTAYFVDGVRVYGALPILTK